MGLFHAQTPPGKLRVNVVKQAGGSNGIVLPAFQEGFADVTVSAGKRTEAVVMLGGGSNESELVLSVNHVTVQTAANDPRQVLVEANGTVSTAGWTQPDLISSQITEDGWLLLDFVARRPSGIVAQVITPLRARAEMPKLSGAKGVRVRARNGSRDAAFP